MTLNKYGWIFVFLLFGCDRGPNLAQLCEDNPEICAKINEDNHCKRERNQTIVADVAVKNTGADPEKYQLLLAYENYKECMGLAAKIEHIKLKEKKTHRIENYLAVVALINKLSDETKESTDPSLLYYHWTRFLDDQALEKFLAYEGTPELETPDGQLHLATYYAKKDDNKTLALLFHALELYKEGDIVNPEIFHTLTSKFMDKKEYKQAYIWLKVLSLYAPDDPALKETTLKSFIDSQQLDIPFLNKVAESTLTKIQAGKFKKPRF